MSPRTTSLPVLAHRRAGTGEALVLLHGIGMSHRVWDPVVPLLQEEFDVIVLDLPGFGASPPLPREVEPHPTAVAESVAATLAELGVDAAHVAGNSLGGWVALELAAIVPVGSVTLLSPAGLWRRRTPRYCHALLATMRLLARFGGAAVAPMLALAPARWALFRPIAARPRQISAEAARAAISDLGRAPGFRATLRASLHRAYVAREPIEAPVSVSFGTKDLVLPRRARHIERLPAQARVRHLWDTGHVPMLDDPSAVASFIRTTAHRHDAARPAGARS